MINVAPFAYARFMIEYGGSDNLAEKHMVFSFACSQVSKETLLTSKLRLSYIVNIICVSTNFRV